jgi:polyhydroxyalkanoate synthesis repressor PhaR
MADTHESGDAGSARVVIKKYANRRLYNTASSSYVTLDHLAEMVKRGVDFVVYDAKTNEDITRTVLTQIIFEEESQGQALLPIQFLRQLIGFYGNSVQAFLPSYLEMSLASFAQKQEQMGRQFSSAGLPGFDDQIRKNMQLFDEAMKMFSPFAYVKPEAQPAPKAEAATAAPAGDDLADLRRRMEEMQAQIERLANR